MARRLGSDNETVQDPPLKDEARWFLQVLGLASFAVAQPVLDVFGRSPETFVFRGADALELVLFPLFMASVPAGLIWMATTPGRLLPPRLHRSGRELVVWGVCAMIAVQILKRTTGLLGWPLALAGLVAGLGLAWLLARTRPGRWWLTRSWVAPIVFVLIFLFLAPTSKLLRSPEAEAVGVRNNGTPVVMVVFDEFPLLSLLDPEGGINRDLYPNFAALADTSTWYRNYTVTDPSTFFSIPTLLNGRLGRDRDKEALATDYPDTLFGLLGESHRLQVFEVVTRLCPATLCRESSLPGGRTLGSAEVMEALLRDAVGIWKDLTLPRPITRDIRAQFASPTPEEDRDRDRRLDIPNGSRFYEFLSAVEGGSGGPGLYYLHELLPHVPWQFQPSRARYTKLPGQRDLPVIEDGTQPARWVDDAWSVQLTRQRHLLQVQYLDGLMGEVLAALDASGLGERAMVIVTADHGMGIGPGRQWREPNGENQHEILWVPLFIRYPGQDGGRVDDRNLMGVDLLPTIADVLDLDVPWQTHGGSMLDESFDHGTEKTVVGHRPRRLTAREIEIAQQRLRSEAFRPAVPSDERRMWPYLVGPRPSLIGRRVGELKTGAPWNTRAALLLPKEGEEFERVQPDRRRIPSFVWGFMPETTGKDALVAAALNGRVAGVSSLFTKDETQNVFGMLMPDSFLEPAENELELFVVEGQTLRPLEYVYV